ncbi:MAG: nucleoside triphosphate pyrophosphohydrolase [Deltaproteobacteria bacterium]|nr:nucleoside triphosphate pyrophosphohydrolase [Deltaproteobacteria bacterium]
MQRLLGPGGCPWDREQSFASLRPYVLEEACEVMDAIAAGDRAALRDELGDVLMHVTFLAELGRAEGSFGPDDVAAAIIEKLVRRHPHVFGSAQVDGAEQVRRNWESIKAGERGEGGERAGLLGRLPRSLPALARAQRLGELAAKVGFDWPDAAGVRRKVDEELGELDAVVAAPGAAPGPAVSAERSERVQAELGDVLFAMVNLARHLGIDAEAALCGAGERFAARFAHVERRVRERHGDWPEGAPLCLEELEGYWQEAKGAR